MQIFSFPGNLNNRDSVAPNNNFGSQSSGQRAVLTSLRGSVSESVIARSFNDGEGFKVFESTVSKRFAQSSTVNRVVEADRPNSAESVANNILGFIERRLRQDKAEGASEEELEARLNEGLTGFKKGFAEAEEQLKALNLLTPGVAEAIGKTFELVTGGIEDLRERFVEGVAIAADEPGSNGDGVRTGGVVAAAASFSVAQSNSFSFQVETADGDTVTIEASSKDLFAANFQYGAAANDSGSVIRQSFASSAVQSDRFRLAVEGELDDDELRAINDLIVRVENLSSDFFSGDVEGAFNQALDLGYDTDELVGYSLNLRQVRVERATVAYQRISPVSAAPNPLTQALQPIGGFVGEVLDAARVASVFNNPGQLLSDLAQQFENINQDSTLQPANRQPRGGFSDLIQAIVDRLGN